VRVWTVPNGITFARLLAVPAFAVLHALDQPRWALAVFIGAGISDGLDGLLARMLNQRTRLGALLDPVADKLLITTALVALTVTGQLPVWLLGLALLREATLVAGALAVHLRGWEVPARPARLGKYAVFCQLAAVALGLLARVPGWGGTVADYLNAAILLAAECIVLSAFQYGWQFGSMLTERPKRA
jgi:cardiolipin synthase (CMP-forming)